MRSAVASFLLLISLPTAALARLDGNTLLTRCSAQDVKDCTVYLDGFADALRETPGDSRPACIPDGVNGLQMRDVVIKLLRNEPQNRQQQAARLIMRAFSKAWPCHH